MYCSIRCDRKDAPNDPFDWRGNFFYTLAAGLLSIGAIWSFSGVWAGALFVLGMVFLGLFLWEERRLHRPILGVAFLTRNKAFASSTLASFINYNSILDVTFYFGLYLQGARGLALLETRLLLSAQPAIQVFISPPGGRIVDRHGVGTIATTGIAVCGAGLLLASLLDGILSLWVITLVQFVIGPGTALSASPNTSMITTSVDEAYMG